MALTLQIYHKSVKKGKYARLYLFNLTEKAMGSYFLELFTHITSVAGSSGYAPLFWVVSLENLSMCKPMVG